MEFARKMMLVPYVNVPVTTVTAQQPMPVTIVNEPKFIEPGETPIMRSIDKEMHTILSAPGDDRLKSMLYEQALRRYLIQDQKPKFKPGVQQEIDKFMIDLDDYPVQEKRGIVDSIGILLQNIPKKYHEDARKLLESGKIEFNRDGQLMYNGLYVKDSNITRLVHGLVAKSKGIKKKAKRLPGWNELQAVLAGPSIPFQSMYGDVGGSGDEDDEEE